MLHTMLLFAGQDRALWRHRDVGQLGEGSVIPVQWRVLCDLVLCGLSSLHGGGLCRAVELDGWRGGVGHSCGLAAVLWARGDTSRTLVTRAGGKRKSKQGMYRLAGVLYASGKSRSGFFEARQIGLTRGV